MLAKKLLFWIVLILFVLFTIWVSLWVNELLLARSLSEILKSKPAFLFEGFETEGKVTKSHIIFGFVALAVATVPCGLLFRRWKVEKELRLWDNYYPEKN